MVGQTRGPARPNMAPPRSFYPTSPPSSDQARGTAGAPPDSETSDALSSESNIAEDEMKTVMRTEPAVPKSQANSNPSHANQKFDSLQTNVKMLNSEVPQYVKKIPQITNNQILSIVPSGKCVENVKQIDKTESHVGSSNSKRSENQPNFITMQQKINEKLLANQIPIQRLPEQQFILKQVGSSDNIVTMTTAKITESNQNYFAMLTNKPQTNYLNYLSLPVNQQNFITVEQQQKNNIVVMEAQPKTNFVTVPQKSNVQSSSQAYLVHGNGADLKQFNSYLAVTTKPGDANGTTFFTMTPAKHSSGPQTAYLMTPKQSDSSRTFVAVAQKPSEATYLALPANKTNENNKTATFIAMEPNKPDTNIIVTQVLPSSQQSPQVFQLEYAENESGKTGKFYNSRDNATMQNVVPKLSCSTMGSGSVMSTKTVVTSSMPPLNSASSITTTKRSTSTSKTITSSVVSPNKSNVSPLATTGNVSFVSSSGNVTFLSSPNAQSLASSSIATSATSSSSDGRWNNEAELKAEANPSNQELNASPSSSITVPVNTVLSSNVPHSHQYLIPNVDNLKLAAETINKMIPGQTNSTNQTKPPGILKVHQTDQNFQMHNYSKNESSVYPNHASKSCLQDNTRRKYGQLENNKIPAKNVVKYSHNIYSNHQRSDKNQNYGSYKSRVVETRPTNHQRMNDMKNSEIIKTTKGQNLIDYVKKEVKEEGGDIDVEDTKIKEQENDDEDEGVEVRPVFDLRIPLVFQVVLTDHCYGMPMLLLRDEKPVPPEDDKESVISSDGKGEDGEETETAAEGEDSITRCICDLEHDDGYMVCCDKCSVWQHVACVFPDVRVGTPLPEEYLCDACHPRKLDRNRARILQLQRRKQIFNNSDSSDSSSSSLEIAPRANSGPKKTVARRRAEPIPRKPLKLGKLDQTHNDGIIKNSMTKTRRRDSNLKPPASTGRRTKLKRKLESRMPRAAVRRKSKNKETSKSEKECNSSSSGNNNNNYHQKERNDRIEGNEEPHRKSPDLRTRLQMLKNTNIKELTVKASSRVRCRMSRLPQGEPMLVTSCNLSRGQLIVEIRGKFLLSDETPGKSDCLFFYRFPKDGSEIVVDGTGHENLARYARRSCRPNTQMKHCIVKGSLRLYLVAGEDMTKNQEITIAHNSVSDNSQKEGCLCKSKDCPFFLPKNSQNTSTERRRRGRRRTVSEESEGSPVKNKKESKIITEPVRRNSSMTQQSSRSPSSPVQAESRGEKEKDRKLTRDERKIEQAMKIFAQMERDTAKKKDKDRPQMSVTSNRKDSHVSSKADSDKESTVESSKSRRRRRRRRRRSRKVRLSSTTSSTTLIQFNSGDSDISSGDELPSPRKGSSKDSRDEDLQSPVDKMSSPRGGRRESCGYSSREKEKRNDAAGLLLALGGRYLPGQKTPTREKESENEGSPPTPLSSACLLVAAAVGPLAPGFRFPKTKKGLMNEWLSKSPEHSTQDNFSPTPEVVPLNVQSESSLPPGAPKLSNLSNRLFNFPVDSKSLELKENVKDSRIVLDGRVPSGTPAGFGKKRWLRQAISEECDAPQGQGSPPCPPDNVTPLKKRRLARESLSSDPPTTPPMPPITVQAKDDRIYGGDINSPESPTIIDTESEISLAERVNALRREYLEAQERNLLKTYGRYENECTTRGERDNEEFERFNNFNSSPQRVPENLSFKFQESDYYEESNQNAEKPLDLTGEKEKGSSDVDMDKEKLESSPRHPRRGRGRKGGSKKLENEVRTSPRFRKSVKSRKGENESKELAKEEEKESYERLQNGEECTTRSRSRERVSKVELSESLEVNSDPLQKNQLEGLESPTKLEVNENAELETSGENSSRVIKSDCLNDEQEKFSVSDPEKTDRTVDGCAESKVQVFEKLDISDLKKEDVKFDESEDRIVQNGFENFKVEDDSNREAEENGFLMKADSPAVIEESVKYEAMFENSLESQKEKNTKESKNEESEQYSTALSDKIAPIKRKLSITEYLKRKKSSSTSSGNKAVPSIPVVEEETVIAASALEDTSPVAVSHSDEDRSRLSLPVPTLPPVFFDSDKNLDKPGSGVRFKSEPTELERQRENLTERLRREFGLLISDDEPKPMKMDTEDLMPPPPPPNCPYPSYPGDSQDYLDPIGKRSLYHPSTQTLPQSAIYPVGSSNPPNPWEKPELHNDKVINPFDTVGFVGFCHSTNSTGQLQTLIQEQLQKKRMKTYYDVLDLDKNCSAKEIKDSFLRLSKIYHPDRNKQVDAHSKFIEINEAYSILGKTESRLQYNESLCAPPKMADRTYHPPYHMRNNAYHANIYAKERSCNTGAPYFTRSKLQILCFCCFLIFLGTGIQLKALSNQRYIRSHQIALSLKEARERNKKGNREEIIEHSRKTSN